MTDGGDGYIEFCGQLVPVRIRRYGSELSQRRAADWLAERRRVRSAAAHARFTIFAAWVAGAALVISAARIGVAVLTT